MNPVSTDRAIFRTARSSSLEVLSSKQEAGGIEKPVRKDVLFVIEGLNVLTEGLFC